MTSKQKGEMNLIEDMIEAETTESNIALKAKNCFSLTWLYSRKFLPQKIKLQKFFCCFKNVLKIYRSEQKTTHTAFLSVNSSLPEQEITQMTIQMALPFKYVHNPLPHLINNPTICLSWSSALSNQTTTSHWKTYSKISQEDQKYPFWQILWTEVTYIAKDTCRCN